MKNKIIVESKELLELGLRQVAFTEGEVILTDETWERVRKPRDGKPKCVILWKGDHAEDTTPTEEKIVRDFQL